MRSFLAGAYALNTGIVYRSQLKAWVNWCAQRGLSLNNADSDSLVTYIRERAQGTTIGDRHHKPAKPNSLTWHVPRFRRHTKWPASRT